MNRRRLMIAAGAAAGLAGVPALAQAQAATAFPNRPVKIIVPFPPGGPVDTLARNIAQRLSGSLGQNVVVENRAGGNSVIGSDAVAKSPADGYTLLINAGNLVINQHLLKTPYDLERDFAPVSLLAKGALIVCVTPNLPVKDFRDLLRHAKEHPGKLNFAIGSIGSAGHIATELLKRRTGTDLFIVPYKGSTPAYVDLMSGQIQGFVEPALGAMPHVKGGKIRALAVTSATRIGALPDVPTVAESGFPGFEFYSWYGMWAPAATPRDVIGRLNAEVNKVLAEPELKDRMAQQGFDTQQATPASFGEFVRDDFKSIGQIIRDANIKAE
ncbi:MAG TPA: tripartite tricarboxylate transporter substrate binding protein [Burkholderiaceae bacterium]|nr:tripartite tricarboxylate transporter substrate binding protein [Burkholderiaceae bacterium]